MIQRRSIVIIFFVVLLLTPSLCLSEETITGHYCYTYGDRETLQEARNLTRTLSIRNGIESYRVFIESSTNVKNFSLTNDLVQLISSGYLKNVKVLEHTEEGRTICETISGTVVPEQIEKVMKREVEKRTKKVEERGLDNNGFVKILSVQEDHSWSEVKKENRNDIDVTVKSLRKFRSDNEYCIIFITFYDSEGNEDSTHKDTKCFNKWGDSGYPKVYGKEILDDIYPGEITTCSFYKSTDTYKVWLYGGQSKKGSRESEPTNPKQKKKRKPNIQ